MTVAVLPLAMGRAWALPPLLPLRATATTAAAMPPEVLLTCSAKMLECFQAAAEDFMRFCMIQVGGRGWQTADLGG